MEQKLVNQPHVPREQALKELNDRLASFVPWELEHFDVIKTAHEHYSFWKPSRVQVILLAESHVYTTVEEKDRRMIHPHVQLTGAPENFVKLVYCLGYGENNVLCNPIAPGKLNPGTWQFWKIFHACVSSDQVNIPVLKGITSSLDERIKQKIFLLNCLKEQGVWLIDASPIALYGLPTGKPKLNSYIQILQASWKYYTKSLIEESCPQALITIGKGVYGVLENDIKSVAPVVYNLPQPQARLSAHEIKAFHAEYYRICSEFAK